MTKKFLLVIIIFELFIDFLILFYYNYNVNNSNKILISLVFISIRWYLLLVNALEMSKYLTNLIYQSRRLVKLKNAN